MAHDEVLLFKKLANNLIVAATLTCTPIAAYSATASIGLDLGVRSLHFADEYGKDHFAKHYYHISPYLELQLNKNLGLQVGYETSDKRSNLKLYGMNDNFLGAPPSPNGQVIRFFSKAKINGGGFKSENSSVIITNCKFFKN